MNVTPPKKPDAANPAMRLCLMPGVRGAGSLIRDASVVSPNKRLCAPYADETSYSLRDFGRRDERLRLGSGFPPSALAAHKRA